MGTEIFSRTVLPKRCGILHYECQFLFYDYAYLTFRCEQFPARLFDKAIRQDEDVSVKVLDVVKSF